MPVAVIDLAARALVLLAVAWLAAVALRRRPAALRALIWTSALGGLLILPALAIVTPSWPVPMWLAPATPVPAVTAQPESSPVALDAIAPPAFTPAVTQDPTTGARSGVTTSPTQPALSWGQIALISSGLITLLLLTRLMASHRHLLSVSRAANAPAEPEGEWTAIVDRLRSSLAISRPVRVRISDAVNVPAVVGVARPVLLLPAEAGDWPIEVRRAVVLHELAHVARWDAVGQLVDHLACAVYWFVPLVWMGARRAASLRERASDDVVLRAGVRPSTYADSLIRLARQAGGAELQPAALAMARPSRMRERVVAILDPGARRDGLSLRTAIACLAVAGSVVTAVAGVEPTVRVARLPAVSTVVTVPVAPLSPTLAPTPKPTPTLAPRPAESRPVGKPAPNAPAASQTAPPPAPPPAQASTRLCGGGLDRSSNSSHDDGSKQAWSVKLSGPGCKVDLRAEGKIEFNADFTDVATISRDGFFKLDVTDQGIRRGSTSCREPDRYAHVARRWPRDAVRRGRACLVRRILIELDRRTGIGVDTRLPLLLRQGGTGAVLKETALMPSDYVRRRYRSVLARAVKLARPT